MPAGQRVVVLDLRLTGHLRTPRYLRGKPGTVRAYLGLHRNPEQLAYGAAGLPMLKLYRVGFALRDVFPAAAAGADEVSADLYEHWLALPEGASNGAKNAA